MPEIKDNVATQPVRRRLPDERKAIVHHFNVGGYEGYLTVGFYEDGTVGETLHYHRERRLDRFGPHGLFRHRRVACLAVRRAPQSPLR